MDWSYSLSSSWHAEASRNYSILILSERHSRLSTDKTKPNSYSCEEGWGGNNTEAQNEQEEKRKVSISSFTLISLIPKDYDHCQWTQSNLLIFLNIFFRIGNIEKEEKQLAGMCLISSYQVPTASWNPGYSVFHAWTICSFSYSSSWLAMEWGKDSLKWPGVK